MITKIDKEVIESKKTFRIVKKEETVNHFEVELAQDGQPWPRIGLTVDSETYQLLQVNRKYTLYLLPEDINV